MTLANFFLIFTKNDTHLYFPPPPALGIGWAMVLYYNAELVNPCKARPT